MNNDLEGLYGREYKSHDNAIVNGVQLRPVLLLPTQVRAFCLISDSEYLFAAGSHLLHYKDSQLSRSILKADLSAAPITLLKAYFVQNQMQVLLVHKLSQQRQQVVVLNLKAALKSTVVEVGPICAGTFIKKNQYVILLSGDQAKEGFSLAILQQSQGKLVNCKSFKEKVSRLVDGGRKRDQAYLVGPRTALELVKELTEGEFGITSLDIKEYLEPQEQIVDSKYAPNSTFLHLITSLGRIIIVSERAVLYNFMLQKEISHRQQFDLLNIPSVEKFLLNGFTPYTETVTIIPQAIAFTQSELLVCSKGKVQVFSRLTNEKFYNFLYEVQHPGFGEVTFMEHLQRRLFLFRTQRGQPQLIKVTNWSREQMPQIESLSNKVRPNQAKVLTAQFCAMKNLVALRDAKNIVSFYQYDHADRAWAVAYRHELQAGTTSFAVHPTGSILAAAKEEFQYYFVTFSKLIKVTGLKKVKANFVRFQKYGRFVAIAHSGGVLVRNAYSLDTVWQYSVQGVVSINFGTVLRVTLDKDISLFFKEFSKIAQTKGLVADCDRFGIVRANGQKLQITPYKVCQGVQYSEEFSVEFRSAVTAVKICAEIGVLFVGLASGHLVNLHWPLHRPPRDRVEQRTHLSQVKVLQLSPDFRLLVCLSDQGQSVFYQVSQIINSVELRPAHKDLIKNDGIPCSFLLQKFQVLENEELAQLDSEIEELAFQLSNIKQQHQDDKKMIADQSNKLEVKIKDLITLLRKTRLKEIQQIAQNYASKRKQLEDDVKNSQRQLEEMTQKIEQELAVQMRKLYAEQDKLSQQKSKLEQQVTEQRQYATTQKQRLQQLMQMQKNSQLKKLQAKVREFKIQCTHDSNLLKGLLVDNRQENQQLLNVTIKDLLHRLVEEEKRSQNLRMQNIKLVRDSNNFKDRADYMKALMSETELQIGGLTSDKQQLSSRYGEMTIQLKAKENYINSKEREALDAKAQALTETMALARKQELLRDIDEVMPQLSARLNTINTERQNCHKKLSSQIERRYALKARLVQAKQVYQNLLKKNSRSKQEKQSKKYLLDDTLYRLTLLIKQPPQLIRKGLNKLLKETSILPKQKAAGGKQIQRLAVQLQKKKDVLQFREWEEEAEADRAVSTKNKVSRENVQLLKNYNILKQQNKALKQKYETTMQFYNSINFEDSHVSKDQKLKILALTPFQEYEVQKTLRTISITKDSSNRHSLLNTSRQVLKTKLKIGEQLVNKRYLNPMRERGMSLDPRKKSKSQMLRKFMPYQV